MLQTIIRQPTTAKDIELGVKLCEMNGRPISPVDVSEVLSDAGQKHVVIGAHAINGCTGRPRATVDVDVIVQFLKKAALVVAAAFPKLLLQDTPVVVRFKDEQLKAIDLIKPHMLKLTAALLKDGRPIRIAAGSFPIPSLEGVLAAKFSAMISLLRRMGDRLIDGGDFTRAVEANDVIDLQKVARLGELVYDGVGKELLRMIDDIRAGRQIRI